MQQAGDAPTALRSILLQKVNVNGALFCRGRGASPYKFMAVDL